MENYSKRTEIKKLDHKTIQFDLSDSDVSDDENINYDFKTDSSLLDKLELQYYPEPFNTLGQFMVSAISGAASSYILSSRAQINRSHKDHLNAYFAYCKKIDTDDYVDSIYLALKLDKNSDEDKVKFEIVLERINNVCEQIMNELIQSTTEKYAKYILASNEDFSIESFNADVIKDVIGLIKFSKIADLV
jgi:hypothetical protein